ncbi:hypothetical protein [Nocardiopsis rhodophaea]|uniref:hypothetical protein n=1 Tax=Nocardiopsis rhodophaea TaxID=280238 RepID=UPI0031D856A5
MSAADSLNERLYTRLASLDPRLVADYLEATGWTCHAEEWRGASVWSAANTGKMLLPLEIVYDDDVDLVARAMRILADVEGRPLPEVLRDVGEPMVDVQRFHTHPGTPSGTIPLLSGAAAIEGVTKAFDAAARPVLDPEGAIAGARRSGQITKFLQSVRLGPLVAGSYVLVSQVPLRSPEKGRACLVEDSAVPVERQVVTRMNAAIHAASQAVQQAEESGGELAGFDDSADAGVTSRLCEALVRFGGHEKDRGFSIGFSWARGLSAPPDAISDDIPFSAASPRILGKAADRLREIEQGGPARMRGTVIAVKRHSPFEPGSVRIEGVLTMGGKERRRTIWVQAGSNAYQVALEAHRTSTPVVVDGTFETRDNRRELRAETFQIER